MHLFYNTVVVCVVLFLMCPASSSISEDVFAECQVAQFLVCRRFSAHLGNSWLDYLWDHLVGGRSILPGAAMLEMAAASGQLLLEGAEARGSEKNMALIEAAIPAPVVLSLDKIPSLDCTIQPRTGQLQIQSGQINCFGASVTSAMQPTRPADFIPAASGPMSLLHLLGFMSLLRKQATPCFPLAGKDF